MITQTGQTFFSIAFSLISKAPTIRTRAVALLTTLPNPVCMLSLSGTLLIQGDSKIQSSQCSIGSNNTAPDAIDIKGNPAGTVYSFVSSGGIQTPQNFGIKQFLPMTVYQLPVINPFSTLDNLAIVSHATGNNFNGSYAPGVYSSELKITHGANFSPGLYIFENGLSITGQNSIIGQGVTFVILGGDLKLAGTGVVNLTASDNNNTYPALNGVLMYMVPSMASSGGQNVDLEGNTNSGLVGAMYFPTANVTITGSSSATLIGSDCHILIAGAITFRGNAEIDNGAPQACANSDTPTPQPQFVELVQ
jgi:hypothetical protein